MKQTSLLLPPLKELTDNIILSLRIRGQNDYPIEAIADSYPEEGNIQGTLHDFEGISKHMRTSLAALCNVSGELLESEYRCHLSSLAEQGYYLFEKVFGAKEKRLHQLVAHVLQKNQSSTIQIVTDGFEIPWNLLYFKNPLFEDTVDPLHFLGMRHSIEVIRCKSRALKGRYPSAGVHIGEGTPSLGLLALAESDLMAVDEHEIPFFTDLYENNRLDYALMEALDGSSFDCKKAELKKVKIFFESNYNILHFACHGFFDKSNPSESSLLISDSFHLGLRDIYLADPDLKDTSIVVLNACDSGSVNPLYTSDLAGVFYELGVRSVIGTQSSINDALAAEFVEHFYLALLAGDTVGVSLLKARHQLLTDQKSLFGLLYDLHGASNTHLVLQSSPAAK